MSYIFKPTPSCGQLKMEGAVHLKQHFFCISRHHIAKNITAIDCQMVSSSFDTIFSKIYELYMTQASFDMSGHHVIL